MLIFDHITHAFGSRVILQDLSLSITENRIHFLIGSSGAGKSVLMKMAVLLITPHQGHITFFGTSIHQLDKQARFQLRRECTMVLQNPALLDALSIEDNVALPLIEVLGYSTTQAQEEAQHWLNLVGFQSPQFYKEYPAYLGLSLKKRIAIARALALKPRCLILDEPTTGLDPLAARLIDRLIMTIKETTHTTCVIISHDEISMRHIAEDISLLEQGRIVFSGTYNAALNHPHKTLRRFLHGPL